MKPISTVCPDWMALLIEEAGGTIRFSEFMNWALNDPFNGSYASGKLQIGTKGDFVTSPSLGKEFSELLGVQIAEWIIDLINQFPSKKVISLVEIGPGEGDLAFNLIKFLKKEFPSLIKRIELVMVEINEGMKEKQMLKLATISDLNIKWESIANISKKPLTGIFIAHEVLDALPVEILVWEDKKLFLQGIELIRENNTNFIRFKKLPLPNSLKEEVIYMNDNMQISIPPKEADKLWKTELHISLNPWFEKISSCIYAGNMLIIDYALEAFRYYRSSRSDGTLLSYEAQKAYSNILEKAGSRDITSHLCLETLIRSAELNDLTFVGSRKQGLSLLSLGIAEKLSKLSNNKSSDLATVLESRECMLRLIDPGGLGDFRWILFKKNIDFINKKFLEDP